jgi:hypothetical protein
VIEDALPRTIVASTYAWDDSDGNETDRTQHRESGPKRLDKVIEAKAANKAKRDRATARQFNRTSSSKSRLRGPGHRKKCQRNDGS